MIFENFRKVLREENKKKLTTVVGLTVTVFFLLCKCVRRELKERQRQTEAHLLGTPLRRDGKDTALLYCPFELLCKNFKATSEDAFSASRFVPRYGPTKERLR